MSNPKRNTTSCNECKRRKLRCDAQQPQCGFCLRSNTLCETSPRGKRGPKRGHLNALRNRLDQLEEMLQSRLESEQSQEPQTYQSIEIQYVPTFESQIPDTTSLNLEVSLDSLVPQDFLLIDPLVHAELYHGTLQANRQVVTDMFRDQLYFDRVHPSFPILHQRSYNVWSRSSDKSLVQTCLQRIMWILAILLSTQFRDLIEPLYTQVKKDLESVESFEVEHTQSWTLLTICELMRASYSHAWISAGRMFRLIQGLRYHEIDTPDKGHGPPDNQEDLKRTEEKRRVFWMAYLLDHLFSMRNDWPVTLSEHMICTRLPISDIDFQADYPTSGNFISQAITEPASQSRSSFNDCVVLVTICGRGLLRNRYNNISKAYGDTDSDLSDHWCWLKDILSAKDQVTDQGDKFCSLGTFALILGQVAEVLLCKGVVKTNSQSILDDCYRKISMATEEILRLAKGLTHLHFSQVHPLMPMPLFAAAEFLYECRSLEDGALLLKLRDLVDVLGNLKNVNGYEKSYLDLLPQSCISASLDLLRQGESQRSQ